MLVKADPIQHHSPPVEPILRAKASKLLTKPVRLLY
jgi:hypothetical protein